MKPSDFARDERFRIPGPAFVEDEIVHLRSHRDVSRVLADGDCAEFSQDATFWAPADERRYISLYFFWATARVQADGSPGRHDMLRQLTSTWFRARAVHRLEPVIAGFAQDLVTEIVAKGTGEFDLANELAYPLALRTISALVGLPHEHEQWISERIAPTRQSDVIWLEREPADVEEFLWELVRARADRPGEELLDQLIHTWREKTITDLELLGFLWGLCDAGTHDPGTNIANAFCLLDEFGLLPETRAHLDDDLWLHRAGEEVLRFGAPFPAGATVAVTDVTLDCGLQIPAGSQVRLWFSAANRDDAVNGGNVDAPGPDTFDVTRWPNRHLSFGSGVYRCQGAELARVEARVALRTLLRRLPGLHLAPDVPFVRHAGLDDGIGQALFRFDQRAAEHLFPAGHLDPRSPANRGG